MSDLPPSGSAEPGSPTPTDPGRPAVPADPAVPTQPVRPAAPDGTAVPAPGAAGNPAAPAVPGQPGPAAWGGFAAPGQPGSGGPQPWDPHPAGPPQGWAWPAGGAPMPGAAYPGYPLPGQPYGWHPGLDPQDPLVTPPHAGVGGWFSRCGGALRRGWRQLLPIMLLTQTVPATVIAVISLALAPTEQPVTGADGTPVLPSGYFEHVFAFYGAVLLAALIFGPLQSAGWAAGTWVVARQAAGEPVGVGAALRYGLRRALGLWGWTIVTSLLITVGTCFCLLPGLYAAFAFALFGPIYLFERQEPIGRAWRMFHQRFGMVLGRVALVICALIAATVLDGVLGLVNQLAFGVDPLAAPGTAVGAVALAVLGAVLATPAYLAQLVGLVATYAEQRAHEGPVNAARLAAELG
ncbi:hypothetical protein RMN56_14015 [Micromonospora halotolerans]|uniref:Glycerophosphoryl diester phosphodiesterase membrane domain-containing protein n=1 Tax=Micromonospora halotolerans TaxID=709879 RepID=A0ABZ0A4J6_9ACTN|nr:hypothetical protein [Micromonospora halotolerans]WNM42374.1 hypothetical protein RMN56_14015 [Micromonospora halotolerans]